MTEPETPLWYQRFYACLDGCDINTPEGRTTFDIRLRRSLRSIYPKLLRAHYRGFYRQERGLLLFNIPRPEAESDDPYADC